MHNLKIPELKQVTPEGIEIDPPNEISDAAQQVANMLYLAIDCRATKRSEIYSYWLNCMEGGLTRLVNEAVVELTAANRSSSTEMFAKSVDAKGFPTMGYRLKINGLKYILETSMRFDCEVKFSWLQRVKTILNMGTSNPKYLGIFDYEFRLWYTDSLYYSIKIPCRNTIIKDTYYVADLRKYVGIPEDEHHLAFNHYNRRKYEQRRNYFATDHC